VAKAAALMGRRRDRRGIREGEIAIVAPFFRRTLGPCHQLPGTSHRTGDGIDLDGHEPVNLVRGETTPLALGIWFSNEPGIYIPGEFRLRLQGCFWITNDDPRWLNTSARSMDDPFG